MPSAESADTIPPRHDERAFQRLLPCAARGPGPRAFRGYATALALVLGLATASPATAEPASVTVENLSVPTRCAEEDNVTLTFANPAVTAFSVEAAHPAYLGTLTSDSHAADWTACAFAAEALAQKPPERLTLYEDIELWVVAHRNETFWREAKTTVRIGEKTWDGLHLLQVWMIRPMGGEEVLVIYPQDGYWRLRPKAPPGRDLTAFGSSVLIGPVRESGGRPVVDLSEVAFEPATRTFKLTYADGNAASVKLADVSPERHRLDVVFDRPVADKPFAALRSMYVTRFNADAADVAVLEPAAQGWTETPLMQFAGAKAASSIWVGRHVASRHNTSAPDHVFSQFVVAKP